MAVAAGVIKGVSLLAGNVAGKDNRKAYLVAVDFPAYTGSTDTFNIAAVGATIADRVQNGRTLTLRGAIPIGPGLDTAAQAVYACGASVQALTVSSDALSGNLCSADGTELTSSTASVGCQLAVIVDEA